jgi:hypothetical protein
MTETATGSTNATKSTRCHVKSAVFVCLIGLLTAASVRAAEEAGPEDTFRYKHQLGVRLGTWINQGDSPPEADTAGIFKTGISDANFYFEGFYAHRLHPLLMGEFSLGIVNRGTVTFRVSDRENIGNLLLYSILLNVKFYPFGGLDWRVQPYLTGGGGLYYGRRSVQFSSSDAIYYYPGLDEQSATDWNYSVGGGFDYPIADQVGLEFNAKYMPIKFGNPLMTVDDYGALAFSVGVKYLYENSTKENDRDRRKR